MKMKNNKKKTTKKKIKKNFNEFSLKEVIFITLAFIILSVSLTYVITVKFGNGFITNSNLKDIIKSYNKITDNYYEDVDESELASSAINGMMNYLNDKYSIVLDSDGTSTLTTTLDGEYKGIGVSILRYEDFYLIVSILKDSPAEKSDLKVYDKIVKIDNVQITKDFDYTAYRKRLEKQDKVTLTIDREGNVFDTTLDVKDVEIPVTAREVFEKDNKRIGYIYLKTFNENSYKQFKYELEELEKEGIDSLIIDVRSNGGGLLDRAKDILELFIKKDKILYRLDTKDKEDIVYSSSDTSRSYPVAILINGASASASELLASSMKETYGATLIGDKSYGKGKVQQTASLSKNNMIKYTVANWKTPNGNNIDGVGIKPGISAELGSKYLEDPSYENDGQIQKAIEFLKNK